MRGSFILALDEGTSSARSMVMDARGRAVATAQREFTQHFPQPGWVEHDADEIWRAQLQTARSALRMAGVGGGRVAAIGIANQRETVVVWDARTGKPIHNAIVWQDRRTAERCERMKARGLEREINRRTGLLLDPYFSATKIEWILDHVRGARALAEAGHLRAGTMDTWLVWKLTNGARHVTDPSNASRTMLFNLRSGAWDPSLLRRFRIPASLLPTIVPTSGVCAIAARAHLGVELPVAALAGDQQAALYGQGCVRAGMAKCTYGTGCFLLANTGARTVRSARRLLTTVAWKLGTQPITYALEGSVFAGGAAIQWLRDGLGIIQSAPQVNELAGSVPESGGVVMVPAFAGLGSPHWLPQARGALLGMTRGTTAAHIARATLEGIAHQVADLVGAMERDLGHRMRELRADGGAAASDLLMQVQADVLGRPVGRRRTLETTALGAAALAGLGVGAWKQGFPLGAKARGTKGAGRTFRPRGTPRMRAAARARWAAAVERCTL